MARQRSQRAQKGRGNVFQDLGLPDAKSHLVKAQIVAEIARIMKGSGLTQTAAGKIIGITQPEVSRMLRGHFREYSVERLLGFLTAFERDVEIVIRPRTNGGKGAVSVVAA